MGRRRRSRTPEQRIRRDRFRRGAVLTREKLLEEVWDWVDASGTRTVDSHVKALRHKLGADTIRTVHGVGYAFEPPTA